MAKLSEKAKVLLLEENVLTNDTAAVKELFEQHKTFEFTARALGFASRYCGAAMVRTLVENGATFSYTSTPAFKTKYDCSVAISNSYSFSINYTNYLFPAYMHRCRARSRSSCIELDSFCSRVRRARSTPVRSNGKKRLLYGENKRFP